ncbi:hypothetical protein BOTBODRAFT_30249 [Botryobasidium botryosum FD-172 SS1]|uniref:Uncharacterized protein n=1 Tax=Botryobasidium botryosum (strain FD-172 SS1) TaxID=930990 RepID=A0A067MMA4_BOTB1|nr:hypothetical protein BOTBODRAFT_30249 [Botryobasidium botryosum FD-172 SS1]
MAHHDHDNNHDNNPAYPIRPRGRPHDDERPPNDLRWLRSRSTLRVIPNPIISTSHPHPPSLQFRTLGQPVHDGIV